ncbi:MAG: hypothetical protein JNJ57_04460 [Saprospiraceae bacterium]|nr:hypothetical protein [Saprospiraceae bacterium]
MKVVSLFCFIICFQSSLNAQVNSIGIEYSPYTQFAIRDKFDRSFKTFNVYYEGVGYHIGFKTQLMFGVGNKAEIFNQRDTISNYGGFSLGVGKVLNPGKRLQFLSYLRFFDVGVIKRNSDRYISMGAGPEMEACFFFSNSIGITANLSYVLSWVSEGGEEKNYLGKSLKASISVFYAFKKFSK